MSDLFGNHIVGFPTRRLFWFGQVSNDTVHYSGARGPGFDIKQDTSTHLSRMGWPISDHYHLGESILIFRGIRSDFEFLYDFSTKFL